VGNKNFIEINGKKYDAVTGRLLESDGHVPKNPVIKVMPSQNTGVVDGFSRRPQRTNTIHSVAKPAQKAPQKSQTLMRKSVQKPTPVIHKVKAEKTVIHKSHLGTSVKRQQVASQIPKSQHVQKYGETTHRSSVIKTTNPQLVVKHEPKLTQQHTTTTTEQPKQHLQTAKQTTINQHLEKALAHATAHDQQPTIKHRKKRNKFIKKLGISSRAAAMSSAVLAAALLGGFFALQNVPNLSMRLAASRAGFEASMPGYQPTGFSFKGPINYSPGQVTISYKSNTDNRAYDVKQQASNWNSDALLSNYIVAENKQYQTYLDRGRTLYIYDGSNATWVDNGVWYQIEGESSMTTDQLIRIAASI